MWFGIVSLFPEMFSQFQYGVTGRALQNKLVTVECFNPRDFTENKHRTVDDRPYGGGPGMIMMMQPLHAAILAAKQKAPGNLKVIHLTPQGKHFKQQDAIECLDKNLILIAGRYEGIDERLAVHVDEEWSLGDYVLSGGELAALVIMDTITRLIPGVLGDENSVTEDTLSTGLLKYPQYTRPENYQGLKVPDILMSGDHALIKRWRLKQSLGKTWLKRPDLLDKTDLDQHQKELLLEFIKEFKDKREEKL